MKPDATLATLAMSATGNKCFCRIKAARFRTSQSVLNPAATVIATQRGKTSRNEKQKPSKATVPTA
jgi:hypothetical protein